MKSQGPRQRALHAPPLLYRMMHSVMCPVMKLFGLSCRQFAGLAAIRMIRDLSTGEAVRFQFHRSMCGLCRCLPRQLEHLRILTKCVCREADRAASPEDAPAEDLTPEALARIQQALAEEQGHDRQPSA